MDFPEREHSVLRILEPEIWNMGNFFQSLNDLKWASHDEEIWYEYAPQRVSCVTSVAYIINKATQLDVSFLRTLSHPRVLRLPHLLREYHGAKVISAKYATVGDLVFYFWDRIFHTVHQKNCIHHMGIVVDNIGTFYHSTFSGWGYTESNLFKKIQEWRIATTKQLLENK